MLRMYLCRRSVKLFLLTSVFIEMFSVMQKKFLAVKFLHFGEFLNTVVILHVFL